jgi:multimeric flavodoxin WrbA
MMQSETVEEAELNILALVGSPRVGGNTDFLVDQALAEAAKLGAQTEKIILSEHKVAPCLGHDDCGSFETCVQKDDTSWILDKFCEADGVILATPVYYYNASAQLKAFMDRNYFLYMHNRKSKAKAVGIIVVAESQGIEDTVHTLKRYVNESFKVPKDKILELHGYAYELGEARNDPQLVERAREFGRKMVNSLTEK